MKRAIKRWAPPLSTFVSCIEWTYDVPDPWAQELFIEMCDRHDLDAEGKPRGQTFYVDGPRRAHDLMWSRFTKHEALLHDDLNVATDRAVEFFIHAFDAMRGAR